jgi:ribose/xylose/arabinose/galactoside ABC-type transport system permease subunit
MTNKTNDVPNVVVDTATTAEPTTPESLRGEPKIRRAHPAARWSVRWFELVAAPIVFALILGPVYGIWLGNRFLSASDRVFDLNANTAILVIALGVIYCLICGHFDLSATSIACLAAILTIGFRVNNGLPFWLVLVLVLLVGLVSGAVNGLLVGKFHLNSFIATLPTSGVILGIATAYTGGSSLLATQGATPVPTWFTGPTSLNEFTHKVPDVAIYIVAALTIAAGISVVRERVDGSRPSLRWGAFLAIAAVVSLCAWALRGNANWPVLLLVALTLATWWVFRYTVFGRSAIAVGSNPSAAQLAGVNVESTVIVSYMASGLLAAIAGILTAGTLGSADPTVANSYLLPAYAAAFLSTVLFSKGRFHSWGTVVGGFAVVEISQGLVTGGVPFEWTEFFNGTALLIAVSISTLVRRNAPR